MFSLTVCFVLLSLIECQPGNKTDMRYCKMSPTGIEYDGYVSHTESGIPCQYWDSSNPTHKMDESITDKDFKEGSKRAARNYCRNIKGKYSNPWCYTTNPDVIYEICDIPLCNFPCRLTLSGVEYGGQENASITGRPCLKWSEKTYRKYLKKQNISTSDRVLVDSIFPEHSRKKASNYCRNPTGDPNGPWCLVEDEFLTKVKYEKEYCDVKLCNETKCTVATSSINNKGVYSHFVELNNDSLTFDFTLQLWNIDLEKAEFHVALIVHPLPVSGHRLIDTYNGVDLSISNNRVGFIFRRAQYDNWHDIPGLLSGVKERSFSITWYILQQIMSLKISDYPKELRIGYNFPIDPYSTIIGHNKGVPSYYSISGDVGFWNLPCPKGCEEHITILPHCNVYYKMKKTKLSHEISFIVRSDHTIYIELRNSPNSQYPYFKIEIFGRWNDTSIAFIESENALPEYLGTVTQDSILTYWSWSKFQLSVSGNHIKLDWLKDLIPSETIFDMDHPKISNAKWYSICSNGTAHWRFDCSLESIPQLPQRKPPECVRSRKAENYIGNQWVSKSGQPCFPWLDEEVVEFTKGYTIPQGKRGEQKNYCRNIGSDKDGPYCYIADVMRLPNIVVKKESCNMRPCIGSQCKTTGLGREYDGNLAISRSNRTCKPWVDTNTTFVPNGYTANLTNNYCRNPNNNSFGPWCYTDDPLVPKDLCSIEECFVNDACTFVIQDNRKYRQFYLHPDWVRDVFPFKVKTWDPLKEAGIAILIMYENNDQFFTLEVGIENNKKVRLSYCCVNDKTVTLKENIIPNLIPTGYWQGFWVRVPPASIELGYQGSDTSIFSWQRSSNSDTNGEIPSGLAKFISLLNLGNYWVGFNFPCDFCLIEETGSESFTYSGSSESIFYPINYWSETNNFTEPLTLHMRTKVQRVDAYTMIRLFEESQDSYLYVVISETDMTLYNESNRVLERVILDHPLLSENFWTTFTIKHDENLIEISDQHRTIIRWSSKGIRALRFYYFVINCFGSVTTWVANCRRPLIDEDPIDGGWSEWSPWGCNVRCGGGFGFRERKCNNPRPNYKGKPCFGVAREGGECNKFECGCVNPITITNATNVIRRRAINKEAKEGDGITLQCEKSIMETVKADSPGSYVQWLKDGYRMKNRKWKLQNLDIQKTDLYLTNLKESDSGLYMCVINPDCLSTNNSTFIPFTIIALVVDAEEHLVRETTNYELICQGLPLSFILTDLSQRWELNSELLIDYTTTDLAEAEIDILYDVNPYYAGTWQCKISQNKLKLTWLTNRFKIRVIDPPTIYTYLSEEDAPSILFNGWNHTLIFLFLWSVIILEILAVGYIVYWYWKVRQELLGNT